MPYRRDMLSIQSSKLEAKVVETVASSSPGAGVVYTSSRKNRIKDKILLKMENNAHKDHLGVQNIVFTCIC